VYSRERIVQLNSSIEKLLNSTVPPKNSTEGWRFNNSIESPINDNNLKASTKKLHKKLTLNSTMINNDISADSSALNLQENLISQVKSRGKIEVRPKKNQLTDSKK
jgi:hypothetical protein